MVRTKIGRQRFIKIICIIIIMIIIKREEAKFINESRKWMLLYGRRKTGKTFLVKNFVKYDEYFFVKRDKTIINKESMSYETFRELLKEYVKNNKTVVVDEFHRLGDDFLDLLHSIGSGGKIILVSSTLHLSKKILAAKSPLLGLVAEIPLGLLPLEECYKELSKLNFSKREALELSVFCREPITIEYVQKGKSAREIISNLIYSTRHLVPALLGEIFLEEEKTLSKVYEGILRAIAVGKNRAGEIANYLYSRKLIEKESSTMIQQYLKNLIDFGIIKKVLIVNKSEYFYDIVSPLMKLYFYADEKYNFGEESSQENIRVILDELMPKLIESSVRELVARKYGLREAILSEKDREIDIFLLKFKKPYMVGEVKWGKIDSKDIDKIKDKLKEFPNSFIFVPDKSDFKKDPRIKDILDFV
jgi:AAA+ ATPase superfamily predicted ATPase